jgi:hypothetical protein
MSLRERFLAFDDSLAARGVPPLTDWWREGIGRWVDAYEAGGALELYACAGRGSAKSTALCKLALFFTVFGDFAVPPGERHFAICLSRLKEEASKSIAIVDRWLTLLGIDHHLAGDVVEVGQSRGIRIVAASVAAASGWRAYAVLKDERSKWSETGETDERIAEEIDTSAGAMSATHERAPVCAFGSAYYATGAFHEAIESGTDESKVVLGPVATWIAAPHVTEESTRKKERNERRWRREYLCEAQSASEEAIYSPEVVDPCCRREGPVELGPWVGCRYVAWADTGFSRNSCTLVVGALLEIGGRQKAAIVLAREWRPSPGQPLDPARILQQWAAIVRPYLVTTIVIDQYHAESLQALCQQMHLPITLVVDRPTVPERLERYENVLAKFLAGEVELPPHGQLRADILSVRRHMQQIRLPATPDGRHADFAPPAVGLLASVARATGQAVVAEQRRDRHRYALAYLNCERPDEVLSLPKDLQADATLALANGVPLEAVVSPDSYIREAGRRARASNEADLVRWDDYLNSIGSPAGSQYQTPEEPTGEEQARLADLHARVTERLAGGEP